MQIFNQVFRGIALLLLVWAPIYASNQNSQFFDQDIANDLAVEKELSFQDDLNGEITDNLYQKAKSLTYYLYVKDFVKSFIEIPTANVLDHSSTLSSKYLAGRAPVYNSKNKKVGICSASFLCMQNKTGIYTDIANYLSIDNGLIVTWFTPTTLINLELDSIIHSMVTECIVLASTKVGVNPFYGKQFNMIVSSDSDKIYFELTRI